MTSALYNIWICPKGTKTAAAVNANPIAFSYHLEPIDIAKGHFLLRYPIGPQNGLDGQPVKAARVNTQQEFTSPEKFDVFVQGDPVNAWRLAGSIFNASTGLEVFLARYTPQRAWRLGPRQDAAGVVWELDDEKGAVVLKEATMSSVLIKLTQQGTVRIIDVVSVPDAEPNVHLVIVE